MKVVPKVDYQFQAVAREDKGPIVGIDWNKSPLTDFKTSMHNKVTIFIIFKLNVEKLSKVTIILMRFNAQVSQALFKLHEIWNVLVVVIG